LSHFVLSVSSLAIAGPLSRRTRRNDLRYFFKRHKIEPTSWRRDNEPTPTGWKKNDVPAGHFKNAPIIKAHGKRSEWIALQPPPYFICQSRGFHAIHLPAILGPTCGALPASSAMHRAS
jgi:hypothetical protein